MSHSKNTNTRDEERKRMSSEIDTLLHRQRKTTTGADDDQQENIVSSKKVSRLADFNKDLYTGGDYESNTPVSGYIVDEKRENRK